MINKLNENKIQIKQWTGNNIGDEGAKKISESLLTNSTLTELNLWGDDKDMKRQRKKTKINNERMNR